MILLFPGNKPPRNHNDFLSLVKDLHFPMTFLARQHDIKFHLPNTISGMYIGLEVKF